MVFVFSRSSLALNGGRKCYLAVSIFSTAFIHCWPEMPWLLEGARTWSSVVHPCSSGDRRAAAGRAAPASPQQKHSAAPTAAHSSPPGPQTQAPPDDRENRFSSTKTQVFGYFHFLLLSTSPSFYKKVCLQVKLSTPVTTFKCRWINNNLGCQNILSALTSVEYLYIWNSEGTRCTLYTRSFWQSCCSQATFSS